MKTTNILLTLFATACLCFGLFGCGQKSPSSAQWVPPDPPPTATQPETLCLGFIEDRLTVNGGVHTNYLPAQSGELSAGHEVLSESEGLLLRYNARANRRTEYDTTLKFIQEKLDSGKLITYRLGEDGTRYSSNAAVDDLRILRGLLEGSQVFSAPAYQETAEKYASRLYTTNVSQDILYDFYDEEQAANGSTSTLCFSDLRTMRLIGESDNRWNKTADKMQKILQGGFLGKAFPFFHARYTECSKSYETKTVVMVESLLTALHLAEVRACPPQTTAWLSDTLKDGPLYGSYTVDGLPLTDIQSTAVYALCVMIACEIDDKELGELSLSRMNAFQVTDPESEVYGGYANSKTLAAYSFDNLMALLSHRLYAEEKW